MSDLEKTVRAIYRANNATVLGARDEATSPEWETFFKKSREGLRKQEQPKPEPQPEEKDILVEILAGIIERIEAIESRLATVEAVAEIEEEMVKEPVRKGLSPEVFLDRLEMQGAHGELRNRRGQKWQKS